MSSRALGSSAGYRVGCSRLSNFARHQIVEVMGEDGEEGQHLEENPNITPKRGIGESQRSLSRCNKSQNIPAQKIRAHSVYIPNVIDTRFIELALDLAYYGADEAEGVRAASNYYLHRVAVIPAYQVHHIVSRNLAIVTDNMRAYGIRAQPAAMLLQDVERKFKSRNQRYCGNEGSTDINENDISMND